MGGGAVDPDVSSCEDLKSDDYPCQVADGCTSDADCEPDAYCIREAYDDDLERIYYHFCYTPCQSDADCESDELCACDYRERNAARNAAQFGMCVPAGCRTDADCNGDSLCVAVFTPTPSWNRGSTFSGFRCQTPADECYSSPLCPTPIPDYDCCPVRSCNYEDDRFVCGWQDTCNLC
jgi:hypothetical protein